MGIYNEFGKQRIQIKVGEPLMKHYKIGDDCDLPDGVYLGYEGIVVIKKETVLATFDNNQLFDKWGGVIVIQDLLEDDNPVYIALS